MKILTADHTDIPELTRVEVQSKSASIPQCTEEFEVDPILRSKRWKTYFEGTSPASSKPERIVLKAVNEEGTMLGYLAGHLSTRFDMDAEIQSFYVLREAQRQGIGARLLALFVQWLKDHGAGNMCVGIKPENPYRAFYLKYGGSHLNEHWIIWKDLATLEEKLNGPEC